MEKTIARTLESCLVQIPDDDVEYILLDNASTDSTVKIATSYLNKIQNFKIITNDSNVGAYGNHNLCIKYANNEWIKFLHGDDELLPGAINTLKSHLYSDNINFIFFDYIGNKYYNNFEKPFLIIDNNLARLLILYGNFIGTPTTTIFRKIAFENIGLFDLNLNPASDADAFFRLSLKYGGLFLNEKIVKIDDDPFDGYDLFEKNRLMFLKNAFLQLDKWKQIKTNIINDINWKEVYKNESFRFYDAAFILMLRLKFKLFSELFRLLRKKQVIFYSLFFYFLNKLSNRKSSEIRNSYWYNNF
jgi:glycosyltransferase involved in cell wall biosynthesis